MEQPAKPVYVGYPQFAGHQMTFNEKLADVAMDQESSEKASEATRPEAKSSGNVANSVNILTAFATNLAA